MQIKKMSNPTDPWLQPDSKPYIQIENLSISFGPVHAVRNLSLSIYKGELFSLLGASGCGKSSLLRILSGFETPTSGKVIIDGQNITHWPAYKRPVNMMFQSYSLFPHLNVFQNVAYGLQQEGLPKKEIKERVEQTLELVQMNDYLLRRPSQLSGGQKQRVALARSLVKQPKLLLLDEPMAALDKKLREQTQFELVNIQEKVGITFIVVTHDQEEAMTMSTRIAVMKEGRIRQIGVPHDIYEFPNCRYVAEFIGTMNVFEGIVVEEEPDHVAVRSPQIDCELYITHAGSVPVGGHVAVAIRPEKIMFSPQNSDTNLQKPTDFNENKALKRNITSGVVREIGYLGDMSIYHVELSSGKIVQVAMSNSLRFSDRSIQWDDIVHIYWRPENGIVLAG